ncbi:MAG: fibronectin type III domain-containing protein [Thermoguttaceae bacterium]
MLGTSGTFSAVAFLPPGSNQYLDTYLTPGNAYTYEVRATNFMADSAWSNQAAVTLPSLPDAVTDAMATGVTTNSISMTWSPEDDNGTMFRIFRIAAGSGGNPIFVTSLPDDPNDPITNYTDTGSGGLGLTPGIMYTYEVECGNLAGFSAYSQFSVQTLTNAPAQLLAVPANGQVTVSWNAPVGAETFNIYRGTAPGGEGATPLVTGVTGTAFVDTTVTNGTEYYYRVTAVDTGGESPASAESSALPQISTAPAAPPINVTATSGDKTVALAWQATAGASTYNVYRGTASGSEVLLQSGVAGPDYTDSGLTDGVTYYYQVTAVNQMGESPRSSEVSATPHVTTPPTPINVTATPGDNQVSLSWSAASDALTYNIYRSTDTGNEVLYQQGITGTSYIDAYPNVINGVTYYYQVSAGNGVGESNLSQEVSATPLPPLPATPASLTATALSSSQISLTWTESAGTATSFTLERSTDGVNFTPLTTLDGTATSFVDANGLTPGITYSFELSATNLAGTSAWSNIAATPPKMAVSPPWADADIGSPTLAGSAYESDGMLVVKGTGSGIGSTSDQFHFVYVPFSGNGTIIAQVATQGDTNGAAEAGVMFRNSLSANSPCVTMVVTPINGAAFQSRTATGASMSTTDTGQNSYVAPDWVELVRSGSTITGYVSTNGTTWTKVGTVSITMNTALYVGLCDTSDNTGLVSEATFNQISINGSTAPKAPSGLTASAASGTSVALAWTNNDNLSFANEVYRQDPGSATFSWIATLPANATSYLDTGLTPGGSYNYQVMASNTVGNAASNAAPVTTPVPPLAVSDLQPNSITTTSTGLAWVLNSTNDTGVQVWRRVGGAGSFSLVTTLPANTTSYVDSGLQPGTLYEYQVSAIDLAGSSPAANTGLTTLPLAPVVTATTLAGQVQLSWMASNGAVAYNIYRGLAPGGEGAAPYATVNNATGFTDAGVTGGQTYYYRVTAVDFSGESAPSAEVAAAVPVVTEQAEWNSAVNGSWNTYGNWEDAVSGATVAAPGVRGVTGDTVLFASATGSTVTLDGASPSVAAITFDNSSVSYTVSQGTGGALHLNNGGNNASITVSAGSHTISAPLVLDSSVLISPAAGSALAISGAISGTGTSLTVTDHGAVTLSGTNSYTGGTVVTSGTLMVANANAIPSGTSLAVGAGGVFVFGSISGQSKVTAGIPSSAAGSSTRGRLVSVASPSIEASSIAAVHAAPILVTPVLAVTPQTRLLQQLSSTKSLPLLTVKPKATVAATGQSRSNQIKALDAVLRSFSVERSVDLAWVALEDLDAQQRARQDAGPMSLIVGEVWARLALLRI